MKSKILITLVTAMLFSCSSTNNDVDELRQEVEQLKIDNQNLADEVVQNNTDQDLNNYSEESAQPISSSEEKQIVNSNIKTSKNGKRMSPEEFGKALHKESTAKLNTRQDKNEYSRQTWGGN